MPTRYELPSQEFIARFRARLPGEIAQTFTDTQLRALEAAFGSRAATRHTLRLRLTIPLPRRRYYLVLFAGRDRRNADPKPVLAGVAGPRTG
jgi:hypothetical protein